MPWNVTTTAATVPEVNEVVNRVATTPEGATPAGDFRETPDVLDGDRGSASEAQRQALRPRDMAAPFAQRRPAHGRGWGVYRWGVERTESGWPRWRRRTDRNGAVQDLFGALAFALIWMWFW